MSRYTGYVNRRADIVSGIAIEGEMYRREAEKTLDALMNVITRELKKGGHIELEGLGTFFTVKGKIKFEGAELSEQTW